MERQIYAYGDSIAISPDERHVAFDVWWPGERARKVSTSPRPLLLWQLRGRATKHYRLVGLDWEHGVRCQAIGWASPRQLVMLKRKYPPDTESVWKTRFIQVLIEVCTEAGSVRRVCSLREFLPAGRTMPQNVFGSFQLSADKQGVVFSERGLLQDATERMDETVSLVHVYYVDIATGRKQRVHTVEGMGLTNVLVKEWHQRAKEVYLALRTRGALEGADKLTVFRGDGKRVVAVAEVNAHSGYVSPDALHMVTCVNKPDGKTEIGLVHLRPPYEKHLVLATSAKSLRVRWNRDGASFVVWSRAGEADRIWYCDKFGSCTPVGPPWYERVLQVEHWDGESALLSLTQDALWKIDLIAGSARRVYTLPRVAVPSGRASDRIRRGVTQHL